MDDVRYAGIVSRLAAGLIDIVAFAALSAGSLFLTQAAIAMLNAEPFGDVVIGPNLAGTIISGLLFVYFTGAWTIAGRSLGEGLMGLRITRTDGRRMKFLRALVRFAVSFVSFAACGIGFLWMLVDGRRRTWQDIAARTVVVYDFDPDGVHRTHTGPARPVPQVR